MTFLHLDIPPPTFLRYNRLNLYDNSLKSADYSFFNPSNLCCITLKLFGTHWWCSALRRHGHHPTFIRQKPLVSNAAGLINHDVPGSLDRLTATEIVGCDRLVMESLDSLFREVSVTTVRSSGDQSSRVFRWAGRHTHFFRRFRHAVAVPTIPQMTLVLGDAHSTGLDCRWVSQLNGSFGRRHVEYLTHLNSVSKITPITVKYQTNFSILTGKTIF